MLPQAKQLISDPKLYSAGFGLFDKSQQAPLPLTKVDIKADIHESIAKVTFSQTYQNPSDLLLETEYFFPIPPNARFDTFQACYEGVTINGIIKEKERAQKEYQENLQKGNTVAYSEILKEAVDVMKVQIGNIKPFTQIQITFSYIQKLAVVRSRFYKFVFYSTLGPRYHSKSNQSTEKDTLTLSQYPVLKPKEGYIWNIEVNVKCKSPITYLDCPSHKIVKSQENSNLFEGKVSLEPTDDSQAIFNKNFEVLFSYENINAPICRLAKNENGYCAMIDFLPRYDEDSLDDAIKAATQQSTITVNPDDVNMLTATGEYIFLIDRSGSMSGRRIQMAKEALVFALKSLPPNSFFNVYSFGSSYSSLSSSSMVSDEKNVNNAIQQVQSFDADMGGTEIYSAIQNIFSQARKKNHPRTLFLLTDGEVDDPEKVISLIESNNHRARVFSLGIGDGCSTYLVGGCASAGRGKSEFVYNLDGIAEKVISLMESAFTPVCDDFTLEFADKEAVEMVAPDPQSITYLLRDEKATFYVFLKNEAVKSANEKGEFLITLKNFDTATGGYRTSPITLNLKEYETSLDLFKLGIGEAADILEKKSRALSTLVLDNPDVLWAMKEDINDALVKMSVENQVLTRRTAFVAVVKENSPDEIGSLEKEKTLMPQVLSSDYVEKPQRKFAPIYDNSSPRNMMRCGSYHLDECEEYSDDDEDVSECLAISHKSQMSQEEEEEIKMNSDESVPRKASITNMKKELERAVFEPLSSKAEELEETAMNFSEKSVTESLLVRKDSEQKQDIGTSEKKFSYVIQSQKPLGNWEVTSLALQILGITREDLLAKAPEAVKNAKGSDLEQVAITLLLLVWMERYFESKKGAWSLIHKKGVQWLKSVGVKYADVIGEINFI